MPIDPDSEQPMPHQPGVMLVHLLNRCNLFCRHCYMDAAPWRDTSLPLELVTRSMGEAARLGIGNIWLSGGEPFLYPDLSEALRFAAGQEIIQVHVSTNGTLIGPEEAALLKDTGVKAQVSIDGPEAYHDDVRGIPGAFKRASRGIEHLTAAGVLVGIVMVVCEDNLASLPWLAEWAAGMGVERITAQPLLQFGRGAQIKQKTLSEEQLCDLFLRLSDLSQTYGPQGLRFALTFRTRRLLAEHPCAAYVCNGDRCHRGVAKEIKRLIIREDGTVFPESPMLNPRFALGSLYEGTLQELVAHYFANGYALFDRLCRSVYQEVMPAWTSPLIPWNEILCERSWTFDGSSAPEGT
jgi:Fe-coproporphyrin III synthase